MEEERQKFADFLEDARALARQYGYAIEELRVKPNKHPKQ